MTTFDDREKGFESKYALDQEQEFKVMARRNKLWSLKESSAISAPLVISGPRFRAF